MICLRKHSEKKRVKDRRFHHLTDAIFSIIELIRKTTLTELTVKTKQNKPKPNQGRHKPLFLPDFLLDQFW